MTWLQRLGSVFTEPRGFVDRMRKGRAGRGANDVFALLALKILCTELPRFVKAIAVGRGTGFLNGVTTALVVLQGALPIVLAILVVGTIAGWLLPERERDFGVDLAAYAAVPYVVLRVVESTAAYALSRDELPTRLRIATGLVAVLAGIAIVVLGVARLRRDATAPSPPRRSATVVGLAVLVALGLAAVGPLRYTVANFATLSTTAVRRGALAPDFAARTLDDNGTVRLAALRGKSVALVFWATWCGVCKQELPTLSALATTLDPARARIFAVSGEGWDMAGAMRALQAKSAPSLPMLVDDGHSANLYNVTSLPTIVIVAPDGTIKQTFLGFTRQSTLAAALAD